MSNIISIKNKKRTDCPHKVIMVDESLWQIECADCGEIIDPVHFLYKMALKQSNAEWRINELKQEEIKLLNKKRCKCEYCGKITKISR